MAVSCFYVVACFYKTVSVPFISNLLSGNIYQPKSVSLFKMQNCEIICHFIGLAHEKQVLIDYHMC